MKKIGEYTARGVVSEDETENGFPHLINLFDGRFDTAYKITSFKIWPTAVESGNAALGKLSKNDDGSTARATFFRADDDNQIAWAATEVVTDGGAAGGFTEEIIDHNNLVVEDLYVYIRCEDHGNLVNYMITMDKYEISEWKGALTMAVDRAQGDIS
jgi:hypothetical protein